jgi:hypothetical protein
LAMPRPYHNVRIGSKFERTMSHKELIASFANGPNLL